MQIIVRLHRKEAFITFHFRCYLVSPHFDISGDLKRCHRSLNLYEEEKWLKFRFRCTTFIHNLKSIRHSIVVVSFFFLGVFLQNSLSQLFSIKSFCVTFDRCFFACKFLRKRHSLFFYGYFNFIVSSKINGDLEEKCATRRVVATSC